MTKQQAIRDAWRASQQLRPYAVNADVLSALIPPGGEWKVVAEEGAVTRSVFWGRVEVASVNPQGFLDDTTEGQITMALRATPVLDTALRTILELARRGASSGLIAEIAETSIAYVEIPALALSCMEADEDGPCDEDDRQPF